jgi:hypothetical protein
VRQWCSAIRGGRDGQSDGGYILGRPWGR